MYPTRSALRSDASPCARGLHLFSEAIATRLKDVLFHPSLLALCPQFSQSRWVRIDALPSLSQYFVVCFPDINVSSGSPCDVGP